MRRPLSALLLGLALLVLGPPLEALAQRGARGSGARPSVSRPSVARPSVSRQSGSRISRPSFSRPSPTRVSRPAPTRISGPSRTTTSVPRSVRSTGPSVSAPGTGFAPPTSTSTPTRYAPRTSVRPSTPIVRTVRPTDPTTSRPTTTLRGPSGIDLYSRRTLSPGASAPGRGSTGSTLRPSPSTPETRPGETPAPSTPRTSPGRVRFPAPSGTLERTPSSRRRSGDEARSPSRIGAVDRYRGTLDRTPGRTPRPDLGRGSTPVAESGGARRDSVRYGNGPVRRLAEPLRGARTTAPGRTLAPDRTRPGRSGTGSGKGLGSPGSTGSKTGVRGAGELGPRGGSATRTVDTGRVRGVASRLGELDGLRRTNPESSDRIILTGNVIGRAQYTGLRAGIAALGGVYAAPYRGIPYSGYGGYYGYGGYGWCYTPWGFSYYRGRFSFSFRFGYGWNYPCYSYWWPTYVSCWYPLWYWCYRPYYYSSYYPAYASTVVYQTVYADEGGQASEAAPAAQESYEAIDESRLETPRVAAPEPTLGVAAQRYLVLGDRAFREGRYTHAVQFYAKAVELAPTEGALYLVLADALFAAGDYHYGAYAVRRALELDPTLVDAAVDKHGFYTDPRDFDRQLAVLELYVEEHPTDRDARLMLAINFLMGGRPAAAVDLLESPASAGLAGDAAAELILDAARRAQFGPRAPIETGDTGDSGDTGDGFTEEIGEDG